MSGVSSASHSLSWAEAQHKSFSVIQTLCHLNYTRKSGSLNSLSSSSESLAFFRFFFFLCFLWLEERCEGRWWWWWERCSLVGVTWDARMVMGLIGVRRVVGGSSVLVSTTLQSGVVRLSAVASAPLGWSCIKKLRVQMKYSIQMKRWKKLNYKIKTYQNPNNIVHSYYPAVFLYLLCKKASKSI